jgi:hypothetical protein
MVNCKLFKVVIKQLVTYLLRQKFHGQVPSSSGSADSWRTASIQESYILAIST